MALERQSDRLEEITKNVPFILYPKVFSFGSVKIDDYDYAIS